MPILSTSELAIHYETAGRGRNVLVLVHGNFATWRWWKPIAQPDSAVCRCWSHHESTHSRTFAPAATTRLIR